MRKKISGAFLAFVLLPGILFAAESTAIDSLKKELAISSDTVRINLLNKLYRLTVRSGSDEAEAYASEAFNLSRETDYKKGIAVGFNYLGNIKIQEGKIDSARIYFLEALKIFRETGNRNGEGKTLNNIGISYEKKGAYNDALKYYLDAYEIFKSTSFERGMASVCNNLGTIYYLLNNPVKALDFYFASLSIRPEDDLFGRKQCYANIATVHFESLEPDSAKYYFNKCLEIEKELDDVYGLGRTYNNLGSIYLEKGLMDSAMTCFNQALDYSQTCNDQQNIISIRDNIGLVYQERGDHEKAIDYFHENLSLAQNLGLKEELKNAYQHLSETYALDKQYLEAYKTLKLYEAIKSDLLIEQGLIAETEAVFLKQRHENEMLKIEKEREVRKGQMIIVISILLMLIITTIFLYVFSRIRQQSRIDKAISEQQKLQFRMVLEAQENERKRIAGDLHDSVGQILAMTKLNFTELIDQIGPGNKEQKELFDNLLVFMDDAVDEVRNISHALMPGALIRLGLVSAIKELIRRYADPDKLKISFDAGEFRERLKESVEIALYRIVQEILNNTVKHAQASEVKIALGISDGVVQLEIIDNGIGLNDEKIKNSAGIGWKNINSRLQILNGKVELIEHTGMGTHLKITVPVSN